jgi:hypothetical protein
VLELIVSEMGHDKRLTQTRPVAWCWMCLYTTSWLWFATHSQPCCCHPCCCCWPGATKASFPQLAASLRAELASTHVGVHVLSPGAAWKSVYCWLFKLRVNLCT